MLNYIFPKTCILCTTEGSNLCPSCIETIQLPTTLPCPYCYKQNTNGHTCSNCNPKPLNQLIYLSEYNEKIQSIIHAYKYQYIESLEAPLTKLLLNIINPKEIPEDSIITHVPLHWKKYNKRGFNQSHKIALTISQKLNIPHQTILRKTKNTKTQAKLTKKERIQNNKNAFKLVQKAEIQNKHIILVDDVATTLTTLNECANVLKKHKATSITGLVIARDI